MPKLARTPNILFHYTSSGAFRAIAQYKQLWASKIQHLNDEREFVEYLEFYETVAKGSFDTNDRLETAFLDTILETTNAIRGANIFVTSFTENGDLLSQWRGYCPQGGYSLGFDQSAIGKVASENGLFFSKAIYNLPSSTAIKSHLEKLYRSSSRTEPFIEPDIQTKENVAQYILSEAPRYKNTGFAEESEWRLYSPILDWSDKRLDVVDIRGQLRPIIKIDISQEIAAANDGPSLRIETVNVSPGPDQELRREAAMILLKRFEVDYGEIRISTVPYMPR